MATGDAVVLFDPARHETLSTIAWDDKRVRATIASIASDIEARYSAERYWPCHPLDVEVGDDPNLPTTTLYFGACGVIWALHYLEAVGAVRLTRGYLDALDMLVQRNRCWLESTGHREYASYLSGDVPILMLAFGDRPNAELEDRLAGLIAGNLEHPARDLMWGSPGSMLAALFLHERTGEERWAELFRSTADRLWTQLEWSSECGCHFWPQDQHGYRCACLDGVHGFVGTAFPLIRGRQLLRGGAWSAWEQCIANTVERTSTRDGSRVNWRPQLSKAADPKMLMQYCHGAPGFVICLADFPGKVLDPLLVAAGETIWAAGPLIKGSNLCHGTGGNGYAFLKLYRRTGEAKWLDRARAFAMHAIAQSEVEAKRQGHLRYSLWTGDAGLAIYLWDCLQATGRFPTLDVYYADRAGV